MLLLSVLWKKIELWDRTVLFHINQVWQNIFFDNLMPWLREPYTWLPLYLFLIMYTILNFGKSGWLWIVFLIINITLTDQVSSHLLKPLVARLRPCQDLMVMQYIKLRLSHCSGAFSFPSSHAANHFGIAMFTVSTLKKFIGKNIRWLFLWAALICYAQMYVGVHYPLDILGGTVVGLLGGAFVAGLFKHYINLSPQTIAKKS